MGFNLSEWALNNRSLTVYLMIVAVLAGLFAFVRLGRNEDPSFVIKTMVVQAAWPGASVDDMLKQVTERLERTLQETPKLDFLRSFTRAGVTTIFVNLKDSTAAREIPDIWYHVRKSIGDMRHTLPAGVVGPGFNDEFGDTFGIIYGFTADGFTHRELRDYVEDVRSKLLHVRDVSKIEILGAQDEKIFVEFSMEELASLGIDRSALIAALQAQNVVQPAGSIQTGNETLSLRVSGAFRSEQDVANVNFAFGGRMLRLSDIAQVRRGFADPPQPLFRVNGRPAIGLAIAMREGGDILALGKNIKRTVAEVSADLPIGIEPKLVAELREEFDLSFVEPLGFPCLPGVLVNFLRLNGKSLQERLFYSGGARRKIRESISSFQPDVVIADMVRCGQFVEGVSLPKIIELDDLLALRDRTERPDRRLVARLPRLDAFLRAGQQGRLGPPRRHHQPPRQLAVVRPDLLLPRLERRPPDPVPRDRRHRPRRDVALRTVVHNAALLEPDRPGHRAFIWGGIGRTGCVLPSLQPHADEGTGLPGRRRVDLRPLPAEQGPRSADDRRLGRCGQTLPNRGAHLQHRPARPGRAAAAGRLHVEVADLRRRVPDAEYLDHGIDGFCQSQPVELVGSQVVRNFTDFLDGVGRDRRDGFEFVEGSNITRTRFQSQCGSVLDDQKILTNGVVQLCGNSSPFPFLMCDQLPRELLLDFLLQTCPLD